MSHDNDPTERTASPTPSDEESTADPPEWAKRRARELAATIDDPDAPDGAGGVAGDRAPDATDGASDDRAPDVPADAVDEAERLTRLARNATDESAASAYRARREAIADDHGYTSRVRDEDDTLVLYPDEWVADGTVRIDRIEDTDRAVEVSLSGPGDPDRYREVAAYNDAVVDAIEATAPDETVDAHAATARSLAAFASNHYVRRVDDLTPDMRTEFREEYLPRNGWPTDEQRALLSATLELVDRVAADVDDPVQ